MKLPAGQGLWPAFWMLPEHEVNAYATGKYDGWAASGEIYILEVRGRNTGTITEFNTYAIELEPEEIRWYLNGNLYFTANNWYSDGGAYPAPFDQPFHLLINLAVGGWFDGDPPEDADYFPAEMEVEYVRVYQSTDGSDDGSDDGDTSGPRAEEDRTDKIPPVYFEHGLTD